MRLTDKKVAALKPRSDRYEIADVSGLRVTVQPSGAKSFCIRYRFNGKTAKHTLGPYPQINVVTAQDLASKAFKKVAHDVDPRQAERQQDTVAILVAQFLDTYVARHNKASTAKEAKRLFTTKVLPKLGGVLVGKIRKRDIIELNEAVLADGPYAANRLFAAVRKFFNWCVERDILTVSPCQGVRAPAKEAPRDRVLTDPELAAIYAAADKLGWPYGVFVKLLALTGQRRGEVAGMMWSEIDLKTRTWNIPRERTKNSEPHAVPLSPQAIAILESCPRVVGSDYVLGSQLDAFNHIKAQLKLPQLGDWRFHDLRRTCVTWLCDENRVAPHVVEALVNHQSGHKRGVAGVYNRATYLNGKRAAADLWGQHVAGLKRVRLAA